MKNGLIFEKVLGAKYVRPSPYLTYPYFAAEYIGGNGLAYSSGNWVGIGYLRTEQQVRDWILQQMAELFNGLFTFEAVAQFGPLAVRWIEAIEAGDFERAMELGQAASRDAEDQPAYVGGRTASFIGEADEDDEYVFRDISHPWSTGNLHNETPWDADYQDIWVDQKSHLFIPLTGAPLKIRDEIKSFAQMVNQSNLAAQTSK